MKVFVRSQSPSARYDIETAREMSYHTYCDPDMANRASEILSPKFKGRIFSEEDWSVLEQISLLAKETGREFEIHDVSSIKGRIIAIKYGIRKTPAIVINGERFEGKERVLEAVTTK
ncbi:MAG: DsbA family protein [Candidatus Bathyarchaeia archaeon]|jgi:hypothetical protein